MKIKPCPFCGEEKIDIFTTLEGLTKLRCPCCITVEQTGNTDNQAIQSWNRRNGVLGG